MKEIIRQILDEHGQLPVRAATLDEDRDLYASGLSSFAAVQLMLALEEKFEVEFPDKMLNRKSWSTINMICNCLMELKPQGIAA
jgi:acyl carrier protein